MKRPANQKLPWVVWLLVSTTLLLLLLFCLSPGDRGIAWRTLALGALASLIAIPLGVLLAWVAQGRGRIAAGVRTFCVVGVLLPVFVQVSAWDAAFGKLGLLGGIFGGVLEPVVSRWPAAVWIHAMIAAPQVAILFLVAIWSGSESWEDALRLEVSSTAANFRILLWRFTPVAIAAILWTMIGCAREIGVTDIYQIGTLSEQVYLGYSLGQLNALAASWTADQLADAQNLGTGITLLVVSWLAASALFAFFFVVRSVERSESQRPFQPFVESATAKLLGVALLFVVVGVPIGNLIGRVGFLVRRIDGQPAATWSLEAGFGAIASVFRNFREEFVWSFLIATVAATIVCAIALPLVWWCRKSLAGKVLAGLLFGVLSAAPGPSIGLWVGKLFSAVDGAWVEYLYDRTIAAPVLANVLFCLPLAIPVFWFLVARISNDQQQHATVEGVSAWQQFVHFGLLGPWRSNLGAWFLVAAICFGELSATQMVLPPGIDSVPRLALGMLHAGVNESTAALTLVTLLPVILFGILAQASFAASWRSSVK